MGTLLPCGSHHTCFFGKVLFTSPVNTQTPLKTDLLHSAFPPLSRLGFLTRDQAGVSSPFLAKNFLAGSQSHMQGPIPCADFQPLPGACQSQSHKRSQMRACTSATRSIQPSQEALCHPPAAGLCPSPFCPNPSFLATSGTCQTQDLHPKLLHPADGTTNVSLASSKAETDPSPVRPAQPPPPAAPLPARPAGPRRCLAVTGAELTPRSRVPPGGGRVRSMLRLLCAA